MAIKLIHNNILKRAAMDHPVQLRSLENKKKNIFTSILITHRHFCFQCFRYRFDFYISIIFVCEPISTIHTLSSNLTNPS